MARLQLLVPLLFLVSLPSMAQAPAASEPRSPAPSSAATSAQASAAPAPAPPPGPLATQAAGLLVRWLEAQNRGDFAAYQAIYADGFIGVRRSGAQVRQLDRPGWFKDRARMFQRPMAVQAADATLTGAHGDPQLRTPTGPSAPGGSPPETWASRSQSRAGSSSARCWTGLGCTPATAAAPPRPRRLVLRARARQHLRVRRSLARPVLSAAPAVRCTPATAAAPPRPPRPVPHASPS